MPTRQATAWLTARLKVISSMTDAFCGGCNRLRVTAAGKGFSELASIVV